MTIEFPLVIDGVWREGAKGAGEDVLNPATGDSIGRVAHASTADLDEALDAASRGLREWQAVSPWQRGAVLKDAADRLRADADRIARSITLEQGKPLAEARVEVIRSAEFLEWGGEQARRIAGRTMRGRDAGHRIEVETHPVGVVAAFTPWNFPMALAAKKFAGALGAGCSIICKPSEETPASVLALAKALLEAGLPPAAIAVVFGQPEDVSSYLIPAPAVAKITFTGSIPVGKMLAAAAGKAMKPVTMELGGHAPTIICGDVDPEKAADFLVKAKLTNSGQICLSPTRFFVEENICERFTARFVEHAKAWRVGDGLDPRTQMGPLANERRVQAISHLVEDARGHGATVAAGGERLGDRGFFYAPTVLTEVPNGAEILRTEPFGPVVPILPFTDEEAMLEQANGLEFGLSAYVFTNDATRQQRLKDRLQFGTIGINDVVTHPPEVPLGGWKESGYGTEGGIEILAPYQKTKFISVR
ncbi:NAD-dependent succinate-semialdehyde dehydrogenase [Azospirillum sp. A1-3]|uniref:NAD-dependent succinate-semialdehyde dehydrogenase n=1 Tax=Azospirillum sp. A1-3 TaxID=185874 RepID=UPI00207732E6|nr:NAD-dependent succinate-semialdehyde dehydrogenase [Azospirillum sp. A1-3]MCM8735610.1 NAD-dependent succinate-semialdehyde dehydrogenase [Azospirillum sp. A1-3]